MKKKNYSEIHPFLPKEFDLFEEYVHFGVLKYYDKVLLSLKNENRQKINLQIIYDNLVNFPDAKETLEEKKIIDDKFMKGTYLYVKKSLDFVPDLKAKIKPKSKVFKQRFYHYAIRLFLDRYHDIYRACPICGDIKDIMNFNEKDKRWYCPDCHKNLH